MDSQTSDNETLSPKSPQSNDAAQRKRVEMDYGFPPVKLTEKFAQQLVRARQVEEGRKLRQ